jgi:hypothetical protein
MAPSDPFPSPAQRKADLERLMGTRESSLNDSVPTPDPENMPKRSGSADLMMPTNTKG